MNRTVAQVAKIFGCKQQQIKEWAWSFKDALSPGANPGKGEARVFSDTDVRALAYVCMQWSDNPDIEEIKFGLQDTEHLEEHFQDLLFPWTPILQEPPTELDETWRHGILFVGGSTQELLELARNYRQAAELLLNTALENATPFDSAPPILFLYRHTLELYLKMLGRVEQQTHSLKKCVDAVERRFKMKIGHPVRDWILELDRMDPGGTAFRYADEKQDYVEYWVDFNHLKAAMARIFVAIDAAILKYDSHIAINDQKQQPGSVGP